MIKVANKSINIISLDELIETYKLFIDVVIKMVQLWVPLIIVGVVLLVITEIVSRLINKKLNKMVEAKRKRS